MSMSTPSAVAPPAIGPALSDTSGGFVRANISRVPYLPGLDGMRAIAVVAVMVYHANNSWLPGGFLGVEMFFVISGYLITLLLIAERERNYRISLKDFWLRRARRLLPALFLLMLLLTIWTTLFERDALGQLRGDVIAGFFYVSNWYQIWVGLGYTAGGDFAPLRHLWSLAVEEQFYLIWPLVMVAFLGRTGTRRVANFSRWLFAGAVVVTVVVGLLYHPGSIGQPSVTPEAYWDFAGRPISKLDTLYLSTVARAGGLMLGSAFAMIWRPFAIVRGPLRDKGRLFDVIAVLAFAAFMWMCLNIHLIDPSGADGRLFRGGLFAAGVLSLLVIAAVTHRASVANRVLGNPVLSWIGTRSYGLYLYHWPIYQIIRHIAGNSLRLHEFALAMIPTVILTELSYRLVEMPIRQGRLGATLRGLRARSTQAARPKRWVFGPIAAFTALSMFAGVALATAELKENDISASLGAGEEFTTDLLTSDVGPEQDAGPAALPETVAPSDSATSDSGSSDDSTFDSVVPDTTVGTVASTPVSADVPSLTPDEDPGTPSVTVPESGPVVPASTTPSTVAPPAPEVVQLGVVTDMSTIQPLTIPPTPTGLPLVALGDSVMLGAAEELTAAGFVVDAVQSRQLITFLPDMQLIHDSGAFGSVVVVHLGTNGPFSQTTLDQTMLLLADVPRVIFLTDRGDREWMAANNDKIRGLPGTHPSVTVLDWEVLAAGCVGTCFYDDGIHLTQTGQNYYTDLIVRVLGLV